MPTTANDNSAKPSTTTTAKLWDFHDLSGWEDATQAGSVNYFIENKNLTIFTRPNTWDRTKIKTTSTYTTGTYTWRVYVPEMGIGDMASIGAFLYNSNAHELDYEIGYGKQSMRNELNAEADDLIVSMTSQGNPHKSHDTKIKRGQWHTFSMELRLNSSGKYKVSWIINGQQAATTQLNYGTKSKFKIFCSVENLTFMGDHIPKTKNYALFDFVKYRSN
ncbi:hypothetical protein HJ01_00905 [Flavobacterium frigoris PS1]|uniref:Uncharacterized protein n=2 Tax=Flavobacterium frigoris TaxID=229204 RepID=H7FP07_FLAFP|nr:hypothetical protein HJ01_00905 [Flavobacterium frigoris PS1]